MGEKGSTEENLTSHPKREPWGEWNVEGGKCSWNQRQMCLVSLIFCTLLLVMCARRRDSLDGGGERAVEEKALQIINHNSVVVIDSFSWDFPGEPISAGC